MKKLILILISVLLANIGMAQTRITGRVTSSDDGMPIPGATIQLKNVRGVGTATDIEGRYVISNVPSDGILIFSYVGYKSVEVPAAGRTVIDVVLEVDAMSLDEVIVVAYGTSTRASFTGAASVIRSESIKDVPTLSFENAMSGKVAGLQITTFSGQAGSTSALRVRGIGSINASNEPLYVVDGVPVVSGNTGQMSGYIYATTNVMSTINPADIESITVLKDAAASSLYGSRAANGVILITTKRGKVGKPVISFKSSVGLTPDWATENYTPATTEQQIEMYYENFWNAGVYYQNRTPEQASTSALQQLNNRFNRHGYTFTAPDHTINSLTIGGDRAGQYFDWEDALFRTAVYQTYDLSVSGATETSNYYSSLSYTKEQGRIYVNEFDRITGRINVSQKVGRIVEFSTNVNFANTNKTGFNDTRALGNNYFLMTRNVLWGMYHPTSYLTGEPWTLRYGSLAYNPIYYDNEWNNQAKTLRIAASETVAVHIMPDLVLRSILSYDNASTRDHLYYSPIHFQGSAARGSVRDMVTSDEKIVSSTTLNFNKTFGQLHNIGILAGWEAEKNHTEFQRAEGSDLPTGALQTVATAGVLTANAYYWGNTMLSMLSRAEYNFDNKYYASASFRRDGSSRLGPESRWGNFWSVAGSWRIDRESFMEGIDPISSLRLRASYGVNGTLPSANYGWRSLATYGNKYMEQPGGGVSTIADALLSWETSYTYNLALEFGLIDQRIRGTVEYFNRDSKDLLQDVPISRVTGFSSTLKNIGEINNRGVEIELGGDILRNRNGFNLSVGLTASHIKSTVTKLYGGQDIIWWEPTGGDSRVRFIYREGESTLAIYALEWAGVDRETGKNVWYMNNENTTSQPTEVNGRPATFRYQDASMAILGEAHPKLFGGYYAEASWKGFSLSMNFTYKMGGSLYDAFGRDNADDGYYFERIMSKYQYENRWTPENKDAILPQRAAIDMLDVIQRSSRHMFKADYHRLKNITVGYSLPRDMLARYNVGSARVYFNGMNLWTWGAVKHFDPEVNEYGSRGWETPHGKTYTFGVEVSF